MTITTKADAINGAMSVADDVAQGRLDLHHDDQLLDNIGDGGEPA